jgi:hypothetical protein
MKRIARAPAHQNDHLDLPQVASKPRIRQAPFARTPWSYGNVPPEKE